ncbi:MAG: TMEM43 family protein, partial [Planctomycetota bacterium]
LTWILRIVGCGLMLGGFTLLTRPLAVLADVIPLLGGVVGAGGFLIGLGLTMILAPLTIATAWMFYRPLVAVPLLMVVGAGVYLLVRRNRKSKEAVARPVSSGVMSLDESDVVA